MKRCANGMQVRRALLMGGHRVELSGFTDGMLDRLKATGLVSEIIAWKLRLFIPTSDHARGNPQRATRAPSAGPHRRTCNDPNWR
jgi:hypothetical protein